ncbi:MAG: tetratricopeptide repeat protein [Armatimonadota bacterium]|nr:tetratricopeptide repeat protein [Armatimonadota bacterium]
MTLLALCTVLLGGCSTADRMRREFVAMRYMQQAQRHLLELPRHTSRAERELDRALALMPQDEELRSRAAHLYVSARAWRKAVRLLEGQEDPSRADRIVLGQALMQAGERERGARICLEVIEEAHRLYEAGQIGRADYAGVLNNAGYVMADASARLDEAYRAVKRATKAFPLEASFVDSLGWALLRMGNHRDAAFYLERARRLSPSENPEILYHVGVAYARLSRYGDAEDALRRAAHLDPDFEAVKRELERLGRILPRPVLAGRNAPATDDLSAPAPPAGHP